ncbi:helix-turn-helix domain-containing protein [Vibrio sp. 10N.261.55.A7]|uniref:helix-turn-helix domain-containing protein n=1 Tax=Vibrio sp. 10N.261.55.A7 TaxID=1880851 RepID=UPI001F536FF1|nr:helix-turn-helix domain-containing protein [Vibrio sp. 10N.261.55.A7]
MLSRFVFILSCLLMSYTATAIDISPSVFYPLSTQAEGRVIAAKNLYLSNEGGLWIHDVHGRVVFYDGKNILPRRGSVLDFTAEQLVYLDQHFWSYVDNEIYRTAPNKQRELVFSLTPGSSIQSIGASERFIWVADERNFYSYHIDSGEFSSFSLMELYQSTQMSRVSINDAKKIRSKWVLATNSGVFLSGDSGFSHVSASGSKHIETLYYSQSRSELVIGSRSGATIINIKEPNGVNQILDKKHILSIIEAGNEYWIGTETGLYAFNHQSGLTYELQSGVSPKYELDGQKIYALVNDGKMGIWIATEQGIRYFSEYSNKFRRVPKHLLTYNNASETLTKIVKNENKEGYWLISNRGLYLVSLGETPTRTLIYSDSQVFDLVENQEVLILATSTGLVCIDIKTGDVIEKDGLPRSLKSQAIEQLEIGNDGTIWGVTESTLWSFNSASIGLKNYEDQWMVSSFMPAKVTLLRATQTLGLLIGTDHGLYQLKNEKIRFFKDSTQFGHVVAIKEVEEDVWVASTYGLYRITDRTVFSQPIPLIEQNISPKCLIRSRHGVWLTSSAGLTFYDTSGSIVKHVGAPFGVLNNEFVSSLCDPSNDGVNGLLLGTVSGLISVNETLLLNAPLPSYQVLFSQINVNQKTISLGNKLPERFTIKYGDSISFQVGIIPWSHSEQLYYRLNFEKEWSEFEGHLLSFDHLMPGTHTLEIKRTSLTGVSSDVIQQVFTVSEPWYLSRWAIAGGVLLALVLLGVASFWRSRIVAASNKVLKAKVSLKTNQLRHQSRILLTNNQQLRKQLEVRHLIFNQVITSVQDNLSNLARNNQRERSLSSQDVIQLVSKELEILRDVKSNGSGTKQIFDLSLVVSTVLSGWESEFAKSGIATQFICREKDVLVELHSFNLDVVLNTMLDSVLERGFKNQDVLVELSIEGNLASVKMIDSGREFPDIEKYDQATSLDLSIYNLPALVSESGGQLKYYVSKERNLIEVSWPLVNNAEEELPSGDVDVTKTVDASKEDRSWVTKVESLLAQHYADPDFGTATAAKLLFISERSLQRRFKTSHGRTFKETLNEYRLDKAVKKLLAGEKVSDVAFDCGYNDPSYFSQRFKHHFGVPPSQFVDGYTNTTDK